MKLYRCNKCGNIFIVANDSQIVPKCCNEDMEILKANTTDGSLEKHVPVVVCDDDTIKVEIGEISHPMMDNHYIQMIILETDRGYYLRYLSPIDEPKAKFKICHKEKPIAVYEYCNLHSLFKKNLVYEKK